MTFAFCSSAQIPMGGWRMHISPKQALDVAFYQNNIFTALNNGLLAYNLESKEKTLRTAADALSDVQLTSLVHEPINDVLFIGYQNGNLDLLKGNRIFNLPAIVQASTISGPRRINTMVAHDGDVYIATAFGAIVVVNTANREVKDTYYPNLIGEGIVDLTFSNDTLYALTNKRLFKGALNNNFLADPSQWTEATYLPDYSNFGVYNQITFFNNNLFLGYNDEIYNADTIYKIENGGLTMWENNIELNRIFPFGDNLYISVEGALLEYDSNLNQTESIFQYQNDQFPGPRNGFRINNEIYIADFRSGLMKALNPFNSEEISFDGPLSSQSYKLDWEAGKLIVSSGALQGTNPSFNNIGGYTKEDEKWISFNSNSQDKIINSRVWDFLSCAVNPVNNKEIAFGTYSTLPVLRSTDGVNITDTFNFQNSLIEPTSLGNGWGKISSLKYDNNGNLWVLNSNCMNPLKVLSSDDIWYEYDLGGSIRNRFTDKIAIDNFGRKWFSVRGVGIMAFDDNGTLDDISDDQFKLLTNAPNNGGLPATTVQAMAFDLDNNLWIGTTEGMRVLYNTGGIFNASPGQFEFQQLLIEFEENVEVVLGSTHITAIAIDGANRKWIGTANSGLFLFSADGLTPVKNFTAQNSPLLSNNILDIAIDERNGETYFATAEGLISYRNDASTGDLSYNNVKVFPNPVLPSHEGVITIQGIGANSMVKITDMAGKLVHEASSNGGTATWDGKLPTGEKANNGVYLIWTSVDSEDTKGRHVGKVVIVN